MGTSCTVSTSDGQKKSTQSPLDAITSCTEMNLPASFLGGFGINPASKDRVNSIEGSMDGNIMNVFESTSFELGFQDLNVLGFQSVHRQSQLEEYFYCQVPAPEQNFAITVVF